MKYTAGEFKGDMCVGMLNGIYFGLLYSFFTHPFELHKLEFK